MYTLHSFRPHRKREVHHTQAKHVRSIMQMGVRVGVVSTTRVPGFIPATLNLTHALSFPSPDMIQGPDVWKLPPRLCHYSMHSSLLSNHFYHAQTSFLTPQTFLFHSTLFSYRSWCEKKNTSLELNGIFLTCFVLWFFRHCEAMMQLRFNLAQVTRRKITSHKIWKMLWSSRD